MLIIYKILSNSSSSWSSRMPSNILAGIGSILIHLYICLDSVFMCVCHVLYLLIYIHLQKLQLGPYLLASNLIFYFISTHWSSSGDTLAGFSSTQWWNGYQLSCYSCWVSIHPAMKWVPDVMLLLLGFHPPSGDMGTSCHVTLAGFPSTQLWNGY